MIIDDLVKLYQRDLTILKKEIASYQEASNLWIIDKDIKNSGGNLCLHLIGNLKTFIGNGLSDIGYVRQRDFEFAGKNVPRTEMLAEIDETMAIVQNALERLTDSDLLENYPYAKWEGPKTIGFALIHLHAHLNYHLGQVNYHRRMLDEKKV